MFRACILIIQNYIIMCVLYAHANACDTSWPIWSSFPWQNTKIKPLGYFHHNITVIRVIHPVVLWQLVVTGGVVNYSHSLPQWASWMSDIHWKFQKLCGLHQMFHWLYYPKKIFVYPWDSLDRILLPILCTLL